MSDLVRVDEDGTMSIVWPRSRPRFGLGEPMTAVITDPDAFTEHGSEHAMDRWSDDGGRA